MQKIIFFSYDMRIGGMEKALLLLLNELVADYEIFLVLEHKTGELLNQLNKKIHVSEYRVSQCKCVLIRKSINYVHRFIWSMKHKNKYAFSCSYATYSVIGSRLALVASTNSSLYIHSNYFDYYKGNIVKIREFFKMLKSSDFKNILFVSNESKEKLVEIIPEIEQKGKVVNNLIDFKGVKKLSKEFIVDRSNVKGNLFVFVGRLEEESKRLLRLIDSFASVYSKNRENQLWIIGDGKDYSLCREYIDSLNLQEGIKLLGKKLNPYPYMKIADCIVLTSDFEGYPVVYNESLILQKPLIITIPVSDQYIDIRKYAILAEKNCDNITEKIMRFDAYEYDEIDFKSINRSRIKDLKEIIDGK